MTASGMTTWHVCLCCSWQISNQVLRRGLPACQEHAAGLQRWCQTGLLHPRWDIHKLITKTKVMIIFHCIVFFPAHRKAWAQTVCSAFSLQSPVSKLVLWLVGPASWLPSIGIMFGFSFVCCCQIFLLFVGTADLTVWSPENSDEFGFFCGFCIVSVVLHCDKETLVNLFLFSSTETGEKGCTTLDNCARSGWNCCHADFCNAWTNHSKIMIGDFPEFKLAKLHSEVSDVLNLNHILRKNKNQEFVSIKKKITWFVWNALRGPGWVSR